MLEYFMVDPSLPTAAQVRRILRVISQFHFSCRLLFCYLDTRIHPRFQLFDQLDFHVKIVRHDVTIPTFYLDEYIVNMTGYVLAIALLLWTVIINNLAE